MPVVVVFTNELGGYVGEGFSWNIHKIKCIIIDPFLRFFLMDFYMVVWY